ncbi:hypothetical protein GJAV_G00082170 [Gymnothorax javanicus]|nr:hypothetical protein GJAV_G00082170 [Gymnothorax javanicus]
MLPRLLPLILVSFALASENEQGDEWIDPFNMTHYDAASKIMRNNPDVQKRTDTEDPQIADGNQDDIRAPEISECSTKVAELRRAIADLKDKASVLKQQSQYISNQNSCLTLLLESVEQLPLPHEDDFCPVLWPTKYFETVRSYIHVVLLEAATHFANFSEFLTQPNVRCWLIPGGCGVSIFFSFLLVYTACKRWQRQPGHRDGHEQDQEQNEENDLKNDDGEQEPLGGDWGNVGPEEGDQEVVPPVEDVGPEQGEERREPLAQEPEVCAEEYCDARVPIPETERDV